MLIRLRQFFIGMRGGGFERFDFLCQRSERTLRVPVMRLFALGILRRLDDAQSQAFRGIADARYFNPEGLPLTAGP